MIDWFVRVLGALAAIAFLATVPQAAPAAEECIDCAPEWVTAIDACQSRYDSCDSLASDSSSLAGGVLGAIGCAPVGSLPGALVCGLFGTIVGNAASRYTTRKLCEEERVACRRTAEQAWRDCHTQHCCDE